MTSTPVAPGAASCAAVSNFPRPPHAADAVHRTLSRPAPPRADVVRSGDGACSRLLAAALRSSFVETDSGGGPRFRGREPDPRPPKWRRRAQRTWRRLAAGKARGRRPTSWPEPWPGPWRAGRAGPAARLLGSRAGLRHHLEEVRVAPAVLELPVGRGLHDVDPVPVAPRPCSRPGAGRAALLRAGHRVLDDGEAVDAPGVDGGPLLVREGLEESRRGPCELLLALDCRHAR